MGNEPPNPNLLVAETEIVVFKLGIKLLWGTCYLLASGLPNKHEKGGIRSISAEKGTDVWHYAMEIFILNVILIFPPNFAIVWLLLP